MSMMNQQKQLNLRHQDKISEMQFLNGNGPLDRVWKDLEKILDQFEEDFIRGKEELKVTEEYSPSESYFSWDIKLDKN